jgi:GGDEF domain-containing protein
MAVGANGAGGPRPVASVVPPELTDGTTATRAWLLILVAATRLEAMGSLPVAAVAGRGPRLCAAALAALGSDAELARLQEGGDLAGLAAKAGRLAGASDPVATAAVVAGLRQALWSVLEPALPAGDGRHVAALAMRLGHVCDVLTAAALAGAPAAARTDPAWPAEGDVRVTRGGAQDGVTAAVARRVERARRDCEGFSVLAIEVDDAQRLLAADRGGAAARALAVAERAVREAAERFGAEITTEPGRQWVLAAESDLVAACALGERLAAAAASAALDGEPLEVSIGVAVWPHDGQEDEALMAHADERVFAARAAGVRVARPT